MEFNYKLKLTNFDLGIRFPNNTRNSLIINSNFEHLSVTCYLLTCIMVLAAIKLYLTFVKFIIPCVLQQKFLSKD